MDGLSIVLAVHSHCPLSEFVARIPGALLVVSLPCCGTIIPTSILIGTDIALS